MENRAAVLSKGKIHLLALFMLLVMAAYLAWRFIPVATRHLTLLNLLNNPHPLPYYIAALQPYPGSHVADADDDAVYWSVIPSFSPTESICTLLDAMVLVPGIAPTTDTWDVYRLIPFDTVDLVLNGQLVDAQVIEETSDWVRHWPQSFMPESIYPDDILPEMVDRQKIQEFVPVRSCWEIGLEPGFYLAEIIVKSPVDGELRYKWAFEVVAGEAD